MQKTLNYKASQHYHGYNLNCKAGHDYHSYHLTDGGFLPVGHSPYLLLLPPISVTRVSNRYAEVQV